MSEKIKAQILELLKDVYIGSDMKTAYAIQQIRELLK